MIISLLINIASIFIKILKRTPLIELIFLHRSISCLKAVVVIMCYWAKIDFTLKMKYLYFLINAQSARLRTRSSSSSSRRGAVANAAIERQHRNLNMFKNRFKYSGTPAVGQHQSKTRLLNPEFRVDRLYASNGGVTQTTFLWNIFFKRTECEPSRLVAAEG